jgi:NAD-dependent SIR2 family protein deacetylase
MQFVIHGPDIPDALLQAHEEGRAVFFCGAGISSPAGSPGFKELVDKIYKCLGTVCTPIEPDAYENGRYDATLDLLERPVSGQRMAVRQALTQVLQPKLRRRGATDTRAALLQLARSRDKSLRLITTTGDSDIG